MINLFIDNELEITGDIPADVEGKLKQLLTMRNPKWDENQRYRRWNGNTPEHLIFYEETPNGLLIPRGYRDHASRFLGKHDVPFTTNDKTLVLPEVDFGFSGELRPHQKEAARKILTRNFGVAQMPTGSGKTVLALYCIAQRKQPALVVVHTKELLHQWEAQAKRFLNLHGKDLGLLGDGKKKLGKKLTIAIVNSLYTKATKWKDDVGFLVVDECHHVPSRTFKDAVTTFDSRYMLGLSATPDRSDGLGRLINLYLGDQVVKIDPSELQASGQIMSAELVVRETDFDYPYADDYAAMVKSLVNDEPRNQLIVEDIVKFNRNSAGPSLVVSDRKGHLGILAELANQDGVRTAVLTGDTRKKQRQQIIKDLREGNIDVLFSTTQLIGEGFDCPSLSALFLATPIRSRGRLQQVVGRVLRTDSGKELPRVYDYQDKNGVLLASFAARLKAYGKIGITIPN